MSFAQKLLGLRKACGRFQVDLHSGADCDGILICLFLNISHTSRLVLEELVCPHRWGIVARAVKWVICTFFGKNLIAPLSLKPVWRLHQCKACQDITWSSFIGGSARISKKRPTQHCHSIMGSKSKGVAGTDQAFVLQRRLHVLQLFGVLVFEVAADAYFMFQVLSPPRAAHSWVKTQTCSGWRPLGSCKFSC